MVTASDENFAYISSGTWSLMGVVSRRPVIDPMTLDYGFTNDHGAITRVIFESLACKYRLTLEQLGKITGRAITSIHIVGGCSQNGLLCRLTADACASPAEATALGNILAQMIAYGCCSSWTEAHTLVHGAFPAEVYEPSDSDRWDDAYAQYRTIVK